MSAIYQDQEFVITEQDLAQVEQELEGRAEEIYVKNSDELYLESLLSKWEDTPTKFPDELFTRKEYTEDQMEALWDESYRYESDLIEMEQNQMI